MDSNHKKDNINLSGPSNVCEEKQDDIQVKTEEYPPVFISSDEGEILATAGSKEQLLNSAKFWHNLLMEDSLSSETSGSYMNITISTWIEGHA